MYWKTQPLHEAGRIRFAWVCLGFHLYQSFLLYTLVKNKKEKMIENWRWHIGETNNTHPNPVRDRRFPADRKKNYVRYSNFHQVRRNKRLGMMHLNWWCRDQNFRKYFEMRKKNDIRPSTNINTFKHVEIYNQAAEENQKWANIRAARKAI